MRWSVFLALTFAIGAADFLFRAPGDALDWSSGLLFLLAFQTALRAPPGYAIPAFWWCGWIRDLFFGHRLGVSAFLFALAGLALFAVRGRVRERHALTHFGLAFVLGFLLHLVRAFVEPPRLLEGATASPLFDALVSALVLALFNPCVGWALEWKTIRTWREAGIP